MTGDAGTAERVRLLREHGSPRKYEHPVLGFNSRMDALQAVVLAAKLARLDAGNAARRAAAARYDLLLADVDAVAVPEVAEGNEPVFHLYVIRLRDGSAAERDRVVRELNAAGIGAGIHYPTPVHLTGAFAHLGARGAFPAAEHLADRILSLPLFPEITPDQQDRVVTALRTALR